MIGAGVVHIVHFCGSPACSAVLLEPRIRGLATPAAIGAVTAAVLLPALTDTDDARRPARPAPQHRDARDHAPQRTPA